MPGLTRPPQPLSRLRDDDSGAAHRSEGWAGDVLAEPLRWLLQHWKLALSVAIPIYALLRILMLTRMSRAAALEVVRRQGISGIAESAFTSVLNELGGLTLIAALLSVWWMCSEIHRNRRSRWYSVAALGLLLLSLLLVLVIPFTMALAIVPIVVLALVALVPLKCHPDWVVGVSCLAAALALLLVGPLVSAPWMPRERISWDGTGGGPVDGYVVGEGEGFVSILRADDREILLVKSDLVRDRTVCRTSHKFFSFDAPSVIERLWTRTRECSTVSRGTTNLLTSIVLCLSTKDDAVLRVVVRTEDCGSGTRTVVLSQRGPKGDPGENGSDGADGASGRDGKQGDTGLRPAGASQAWVIVGPDGQVISSSPPTATTRTASNDPILRVVRFPGLNLAHCAVAASSTSQDYAGSANLLNVVLPTDQAAAGLTANEVAVESTTFGKDGLVGFVVLATCPP